MPGLPDVLPRRRICKTAETAVGVSFMIAKDLAKELTLVRMRASDKGGESECSRVGSWPILRSFVKSVLLLAGLVMVLFACVTFCSGIFLVRANHLGRRCFDMKDEVKYGERIKYRFALITASDGASAIPGRSFEGLMELVIPNKQRYVDRHGYDLIDASDELEKGRPPSWSKIQAVRKHLPNYDWVFWNDADSLVANPSIALEDIIVSVVGEAKYESMPDFIVTEDVTGVNAGMFFFKNSTWSMEFLNLWWNQTSFVRPFGQSKSGDNDALKQLIRNLPKEERQHVRIHKMQCLFNSYMWKPSLRSGHRLITLTKSVWKGVYSEGDFMVHLAGLNDKKKWIKKILEEIGD